MDVFVSNRLQGYELWKFAIIAWSWKQRNNQLWNSAHKDPVATVFTALEYLCLTSQHLADSSGALPTVWVEPLDHVGTIMMTTNKIVIIVLNYHYN